MKTNDSCVNCVAENECLQVAMLRSKSPTSVQEKLSSTGRSTLFQRFPLWRGWYSTSEDQSEVKPDESVSESAPAPETKRDTRLESLEDEILDVIADTVENNTILRRDIVFGQFNFSLKEGNFRLCTDEVDNEEKYEFHVENDGRTRYFVYSRYVCVDRKCVMELLFSNVRLELESRPRSSSSRLFIALGSVILNDYLTENSVFPVLISPQSKIVSS